jgi:acyl carrier protein
MTKEQIIQEINEVFVDEFEVESEDIKPEADIFTTLDIDSLDVVDLVVDLEKKFSIKVKTEEMAGVNTVQKLYDYVFNKVNSVS